MSASRYFALLAVTLTLATAAHASPVAQPISFETAVGELQTLIEHDHLYAWAKPGCLDYVDDGEDDQHENISIHEVHGGHCPGDPNISPRVDSFRINRVTREVNWLSFDGDYQSYAQLKKSRHSK